MNKIVLNTNEAIILDSFGKNSIQSVPEIAVQSKLTPSQVREGISQLNEKNFIHTTKNDKVFRLTRLGSSARRNIANLSNNVLIID